MICPISLQDSDADISNMQLDKEDSERINQVVNEFVKLPVSSEPPSPHPPSCRKSEIYTNPSVFKDIDDHVIKVDIQYYLIVLH